MGTAVLSGVCAGILKAWESRNSAFKLTFKRLKSVAKPSELKYLFLTVLHVDVEIMVL